MTIACAEFHENSLGHSKSCNNKSLKFAGILLNSNNQYDFFNGVS